MRPCALLLASACISLLPQAAIAAPPGAPQPPPAAPPPASATSTQAPASDNAGSASKDPAFLSAKPKTSATTHDNSSAPKRSESAAVPARPAEAPAAAAGAAAPPKQPASTPSAEKPLKAVSPYGDTVTDNVTGAQFVLVKGGCFRMGNPDPRAEPDEVPAHEVCVSDFYMSATEVTQRDWSRVVGWVPSLFKGDMNNPVEGISWQDAQHYISVLNEASGRSYRLPTEAEWEYAARGGAKAAAEGKFAEKLEKIAWHELNSDGHTHPVGTLRGNPLGIHDMLGNVWEWCSDWYDPGWYRRSVKKDPKGPASGSGRVLRGGSWADSAEYLRAFERGSLPPTDRSETHGFRLVLSP